jgi:hypothetical protein
MAEVTPSIEHQGSARRSTLRASLHCLQKQQSDESGCEVPYVKQRKPDNLASM